MGRELVEIFWMNGDSIRYYIDSGASLQNGVLHLYGVWDIETDRKIPDKHIPISNIKYWDKNGA